MTEPMAPDLARALENLIGPMVQAGMHLDFAEKLAKVKLFNKGEYPGEPCDRCGDMNLLYLVKDGGLMLNLCQSCHGRAAVIREREKMAERAGPLP